MADPFLGEIRLFAGDFPPDGWAFCDGQLLQISENENLFQLIGTTYGGDGVNTFALPELRGRIPIHRSISFPLGGSGGTETVTLTVNQIPAHSHVPRAQSGSGNQSGPNGGVWAASALNQFAPGTPDALMSPTAISPAGGGEPHENMMPFLTVSFIIALFGTFPSQ